MEEIKAPQWILWFVFIQLLLNSCDAMIHERKLTTSEDDSALLDFISIDCGASSGYSDPQTGISYQTDKDFVETGKNFMVADEKRYGVFGRQLQTLRSFPEGKRNCYSLKPKQGKNNNYLIRAFFAYGNYDGQNQTQTFDLFLNVDFWTTVDLDYAYHQLAEIIHTPTTDTIHVCLVKTGNGIPFISMLELRPLSNFIYRTPSPHLRLVLDTRVVVGFSHFASGSFTRFTDDIYDRVWRGVDIFDDEAWRRFNMSVDINVGSINDSYKLPKQVLMSATKSLNLSSALEIDYEESVWKTTPGKSFRYYVYFHFAEIEQLPAGQKRVIDVTVNGKNINSRPITLEYLKPVTVKSVSNEDGLRFSIIASSESDAPPIRNALETYKIVSSSTSPTNQADADAILRIKNKYQIYKVNWQGDPCVPVKSAWEGLSCRYGNNNTNARITSLNLSASKLGGPIDVSFSQLTELKSLDLSRNELSGPVPEFLANLSNLTILNLKGNKLTGSIPKALKEKSNLQMSLDDNLGLCLRDPCERHKLPIPLIVSMSALTLVILIGIWIFKMKTRKADSTVSKKQEGSENLRNRAFTYSEVLEITNNLQNLIGEGGFGKVYFGTLKDNTEVAVKLLSQSSRQGHREFRSEVELSMVVHHRHLVSLIGYCEEIGARALIYEYMANGDLHQYLTEKNSKVLSWNERLQIAIGAATGLDYLHNGCKTPIIHRDLKPSNILLDKYMVAKISDFGLSKAFENERDSHLSTRPAGTPGFIDPEFQRSGNLTQKSDIYSFGMILLQLITGRPPIRRQVEDIHFILDWIHPKIECRDIQGIVDLRLNGEFQVSYAWKAVETAMSCIELQSNQRPDISYVLNELKECLAMEIGHANSDEISSHPIYYHSGQLDSITTLSAR